MRIAALTAVIAAAVGGGYAIAATSNGGAIHACVTKRTGAIRIVSGRRCHKRERPLSWNQVGPRGAAGMTGLQGPPGQPGTLRAFEAYRGATQQVNITQSTPTTVAALNSLPAGAYTISGYVSIDSHTDTKEAGQVTCTLTAGSVSTQVYTYVNGGTVATTLPVELTQTFSGAKAVGFSCTKQLPGSAFIENAELIATQVGSQMRVAAS